VPGDGVIRELPHPWRVATSSEELERAHAQMARRHAGEHGAGQRLLAVDRLARARHGERARGGNSEGVHGFGDQHLAQHGTDGRLAVPSPRERRAARTLEHEVAAASESVDDLTQQQGAPVAQNRREPAELVTGVRLGERLGALGHVVAGEDGRAFGSVQRVGIESQFEGELPVEVQQARRGNAGGLPGRVEPRQVPRVGVVEAKRGSRHVLQSDVCPTFCRTHLTVQDCPVPAHVALLELRDSTASLDVVVHDQARRPFWSELQNSVAWLACSKNLPMPDAERRLASRPG
jgi:hypothetical protein